MDTLDGSSPLFDNATRILRERFGISAVTSVVALVDVAADLDMSVAELIELVSALDLQTQLRVRHERDAGQAICADELSPDARSSGLSVREKEILALVACGRTNAQIADQLLLSINSIKSYIRSSYRKIAVTSRVEAVLWCVDNELRPVGGPTSAGRAASHARVPGSHAVRLRSVHHT